MRDFARTLANVRGTSARLATWSSAFAAAIGVIVLSGWYLGVPALLRIHPAFVPMQFNTALLRRIIS